MLTADQLAADQRFSGWGAIERRGHAHYFLWGFSLCNRVDVKGRTVQRERDMPENQQPRCRVCTRRYETGL